MTVWWNMTTYYRKRQSIVENGQPSMGELGGLCNCTQRQNSTPPKTRSGFGSGLGFKNQ